MQIILLTEVPHLGEKDDVVDVRPGYANNYLFPKGYAIRATKPAVKTLHENQRQAAHKIERIRQDAQRQAETLTGITLTIPMLVSKEGGKIYGSVTPLMLHNLLKEKGFDIDRRKITLDHEVESLGSFVAKVNFHRDVKADLKFEVVEKTA